MIDLPDGTKECGDEAGKLHHEDGPAVIQSSDTPYWHWPDKARLDGGPAVIRSDGTKEWREHGRRVYPEDAK